MVLLQPLAFSLAAWREPELHQIAPCSAPWFHESPANQGFPIWNLHLQKPNIYRLNLNPNYL